MSEHVRVAERGGSVARVAKEAFEQQTGKKKVAPKLLKNIDFGSVLMSESPFFQAHSDAVSRCFDKIEESYYFCV